MRNKIFLSYSHKDEIYKRSLETHLTALQHYFGAYIWNDLHLVVGDEWEQQIDQMIRETAVAILLISKDYLASEFIAKKEVAPILKALEKENIRVLPVILTPCLFSQIESLGRIQAVNDPKVPLCKMPESEQDEIWVKVADLAWKELKNSEGVSHFTEEKDSDDSLLQPYPEIDTDKYLQSMAALKGMLIPYREDWYRATIVARRENVRNDFRCYQINKRIYSKEHEPVRGETHWLFYKAGQFQDLKVGDQVMFQVDKINELRNWRDLKNTRNIYITELFVNAKR